MVNGLQGWYVVGVRHRLGSQDSGCSRVAGGDGAASPCTGAALGAVPVLHRALPRWVCSLAGFRGIYSESSPISWLIGQNPEEQVILSSLLLS